MTVEQGDALRPEPAEQGGERAADRAAPAGDENAPAAEQLLQLEHRRHRVPHAEHALPIEPFGAQTARGPWRRAGRRLG